MNINVNENLPKPKSLQEPYKFDNNKEKVMNLDKPLSIKLI